MKCYLPVRGTELLKVQEECAFVISEYFRDYTWLNAMEFEQEVRWWKAETLFSQSQNVWERTVEWRTITVIVCDAQQFPRDTGRTLMEVMPIDMRKPNWNLLKGRSGKRQ